MPTKTSKKTSSRPSKTKATRSSASEAGKVKIKDSKVLDIPTYAQSEEFTSAAACAMMALKYVNKNFKMKKDTEFEIWQEAVHGSVWHGSRYGLAYALAKRGVRPNIISNAKDEGFEKKLAVYEGINLDTLTASFKEIRDKAKNLKVEEKYGIVTLNSIKKQLNMGRIPIVLVDISQIDPYMESAPHWVVIKGYDNDSVYINDPYSDNTIALEHDSFKNAIGYENETHMITIRAKKG
ncbi:MAG: peptidase C39 family protein [Candidatus Marsarchaeota archaeon]|nr:peptidase C39 family protein [Candidatus Marsarchaeota archaeon]